MNDKIVPALIEFDAREVPISTQFDDPYFSFQNGLAESQYVFLSGNELPARFAPNFHIAELGFGTGLNFLITWQAWRQSGQAGRFAYTSFEAYPMTSQDRARALSQFPEVAELAEEFLTRFDGTKFASDEVDLQVIIGDARATLPHWEGAADAWYLDGFSPAKNSELWGEELMREVFAHTKNGGSFATYSAAGFVRRNLEIAGFEVERVKGFGTKRHMTRGRKP